MKLIEFHSAPHSRTADFEPELPGLIEAVGYPEFSDRFLAAARRVTGCHTVTAFSFVGRQAPHLILANNIGDTPVSQKVAEKYISEYWRYDPANHVCGNFERDNYCRAVVINANDIDHEPYKKHCYTSVNLHNRMTIIKAAQEGFIRMSFYTNEDGSYINNGMESALSAGDVLTALLQRHKTRCESSLPLFSNSGANLYQRRLMDAGLGLSRREIEVCALIARGYTSEGIALELGISINTVLTFRKRAYARLRISSQNELMRLIMN